MTLEDGSQVALEGDNTAIGVIVENHTFINLKFIFVFVFLFIKDNMQVY